jgi:hypothetical protein
MYEPFTLSEIECAGRVRDRNAFTPLFDVKYCIFFNSVT